MWKQNISFSVLPLHLEVPEVVIIGVLGVIHQNMIGVKVGWSQGDILMIRIIETVQNRRLVTEETTEIMILKEADMKLHMELSSGWKPLQCVDKMMSCWHRTLCHLLQQMLTLKRWSKWVSESRKHFH